jgi:hypothetical protein
MLQAYRDELDLGLTLRTSDSQKFLICCLSMLCRMHLFSIYLTESDELGLLNLILTMIGGNLKTISNTNVRLVRFLFRNDYRKNGCYYLVCSYQNTGQGYNTKTGLDKYDIA